MQAADPVQQTVLELRRNMKSVTMKRHFTAAMEIVDEVRIIHYTSSSIYTKMAIVQISSQSQQEEDEARRPS